MNDPILFWNGVSLEVHRRDFTVNQAGDSFGPGMLMPQQGGPTRTSRSLAMVHIAMYEAFALADPASGLVGYAPLTGVTPPPAPGGVTLPPPTAADLTMYTAGAVAGAASKVLTSQWSKQMTFVMEQKMDFGSLASGAYYNYGMMLGEAVGQKMIDIRLTDKSNLPETGKYTEMHGDHAPDPFSPGQGRLGTEWGQVTPFCILPPAASMPIHKSYIDPFPPVGSNRYNAALREVKDKGDRVGTTRAHDETVAGIYWGYDGARGLGVPPRLYNQVVREFIRQQAKAVPAVVNTPAENARLFALINAGMADAAIVAWSAKYAFDLWRPVVGIRQHDNGFGINHGMHTVNLPAPAAAISAECDPTWAPLGRPGTNTAGDFTKTPDFPAYPSGHATFGAVVFKLTGLFYQQKTGKTLKNVMNDRFTFVSDEFNGKNRDPNGDERVHHTRKFSLCEAIIENALSRVYLGVHWRFDGLGTVAPNDLDCDIPPDPALPVKLGNAIEKKLGGVPMGLQIAKEVFSGCFQSTAPAAPLGS